MKTSCVTAHAGARDQYQVSRALYEAGLLQALITDFYTPDWLHALFPKKMGSRHEEGLPSANVKTALHAVLPAVQMRFTGKFNLNQQKDRAISEAAFQLARQKHSNLFLYSYYGFHAFTKSIVEGKGMKKLLFQLHPHPYSLKQLFTEELHLVPEARDSIMYENEMQYSQEYLDQLALESQLADGIMVASSYTKQTLIENGVREDKIVVNPYGIAPDVFVARRSATKNRRLTLAFVGSMVQRKGLSYLFEAIRRVGPDHVDLRLYGRGFIDRQLINRYSDLSIQIHENIHRDELVRALQTCDVFVLPSLAEGFAQVILEAMSCGLPVITTANTCGPDIIENGKEGFITPVRSPDQLADRLEWCLENRDILYDMGKAATLRAADFTWSRFRNGVREYYQSQCE
jgi:glycosyltransferase involved in cell wall biosynthesis